MKPDQFLLVTAQGWWQFANGRVTELQSWPQLQGTALVVVDFADSAIGVQYCKGKAAYAAAQIEKTVRSEGVIDGPVHVFVHRQIGHADSSQTLYTAVPLMLWQEFQAWAARQPDHCLVVPLASLLAERGAGDRPVILRAGQQLHAYGEHEGKMYYASAAAMGSEASDFVVPVRTLATQLRLAGWRGAQGVCDWASVRSEALADEQELVQQLGEAGVMQAQLLPHEAFRLDADRKPVTVLPAWLGNVSVKSLAAPPLLRAAWLSERYVMPLAAMVAVVAVGLGIFAWVAFGMVRDEQQSMQGLQSELETLRARVAKVSGTGVAGMEAPEVVFARQMGFAVIHDPIRMLGTVRRAAGETVRIQRLQLTKANASNPARFRVDGVVADGSPEELSRFLAALRAEGWQAESTAPFDSSVGAFAYYLRAVVPGRNS